MSELKAKVMLVIMDGLGDRPIAALDGKTPLEAAATPNMDRLAATGVSGMMHTLGRGRVPGSDVAHLAIFGYDADTYYSGRGPIEVRGLGIPLEGGDVALRGNLGTVDENDVIVDRRAGRIADVTDFVKDLDGTTIDDVTFIVRPGTGHRAGVIMRGKGLSANISDADPHAVKLSVRDPRPLDDSDEAKRTASVLAKFLAHAHEQLDANPLNAERRASGQMPANYLLVRGAGYYRGIPSFTDRYHGLKAACIAGGGLYKGIGAYLEMDLLSVAGATGQADSDVSAKLTHARSSLDAYDFVFVHIKACDAFAHDGNAVGKKDFIEKVDAAMPAVLDMEDTLLVLTADHTTPCALGDHSGDPVPLLINGPGVRVDKVTAFGERACTHGGLGQLLGLELMPELMNLCGLAKLEGA